MAELQIILKQKEFRSELLNKSESFREELSIAGAEPLKRAEPFFLGRLFWLLFYFGRFYLFLFASMRVSPLAKQKSDKRNK